MKRLVLPLLFTIGATAARADEQKPIVAVFDINDARPQKQKMKPAAVEQLTLFMTAKLAETEAYKLTPREEVRAVMSEQKKTSFAACYDEKCQIQLGKELSADKSLGSQIIQLGGKCVFTATLYDLKTAVSERASTQKAACTQEGIADAIELAVAALAKKTEVKQLAKVDTQTQTNQANNDAEQRARDAERAARDREEQERKRQANQNPGGKTQDCIELQVMGKLAVMAPDAETIKQVNQIRDMACADGAGPLGSTYNWPNNVAARFATGEWHYPNAVVAKYPNGEWHYPNAVMAMTTAGEWHYPNAVVAKFTNNIWQAPNGVQNTPAALLDQGCARVDQKLCGEWRSYIQINVGHVFWDDLSVVEMGWALLGVH